MNNVRGDIIHGGDIIIHSDNVNDVRNLPHRVGGAGVLVTVAAAYHTRLCG